MCVLVAVAAHVSDRHTGRQTDGLPATAEVADGSSTILTATQFSPINSRTLPHSGISITISITATTSSRHLASIGLFQATAVLWRRLLLHLKRQCRLPLLLLSPGNASRKKEGPIKCKLKAIRSALKCWEGRGKESEATSESHRSIKKAKPIDRKGKFV